MDRSIDHLVLPCRDLAAAAATYERLGFQVGRRNRHPWGTENHVIQCPGVFLEPIALADDYQPVPPGSDAFPFAGFLAGDGRSKSPSGMIVLRSADASADAEAFAGQGIGSRRMLRFRRDAAGPDGASRTVAFSLAFAEAPSMPDIGFFTCEQHHPENFWNPAFQRHPNLVSGVAGVVIVASHAAHQADFLERFSGRPSTATPDGMVIDTGGGLIEVVTPAAFAARFGHAISGGGDEAILGAIRFTTPDLGSMPGRIRDAGFDPIERPGAVVARPRHGPALVFESSGRPAPKAIG